MALKKKIVPQPAPKPFVLLASPNSPAKVMGAFGHPFNVVPNKTYTGPKISGYDFVGAWDVITDDEKMWAFLLLEEEHGGSTRLYHGTSCLSVASIAEEGLRAGDAGMFGSGIYLGGTRKAINYANNNKGKKWWKRPAVPHDICYILECKVVLGKSKKMPEAQEINFKDLTAEGFQSVQGVRGYTKGWNGYLAHDEWVVYDPDQVIVVRILEYHRQEGEYRDLPTTHTCDVYCSNGTFIPAGMKFAADVLDRKPCGAVATTAVTHNHDYGFRVPKKIWVCDRHIESLKLRTGSRFEVQFHGKVYQITVAQQAT